MSDNAGLEHQRLLLERTHELLRDPSRWIKGKYYGWSDNTPQAVRTRYCLVAGIDTATFELGLCDEEHVVVGVFRRLCNVINRRPEPSLGKWEEPLSLLEAWNDLPTTSHDKLLDVLERATKDVIKDIEAAG